MPRCMGVYYYAEKKRGLVLYCTQRNLSRSDCFHRRQRRKIGRKFNPNELNAELEKKKERKEETKLQLFVTALPKKIFWAVPSEFR
jgi:hypothetical protein